MYNQTITSLYTYRTYAGCLEGIPEPTLFIKVARDKAVQLFGDGRPTLVLDPELKNVPPVGLFEGGKLLPQWTHIAQIDGAPLPDGRGHDGSQLILIWFSENSDICETSYEVLQRFDWSKEAKGFCH